MTSNDTFDARARTLKRRTQPGRIIIQNYQTMPNLTYQLILLRSTLASRFRSAKCDGRFRTHVPSLLRAPHLRKMRHNLKREHRAKAHRLRFTCLRLCLGFGSQLLWYRLSSAVPVTSPPDFCILVFSNYFEQGFSVLGDYRPCTGKRGRPVDERPTFCSDIGTFSFKNDVAKHRNVSRLYFTSGRTLSNYTCTYYVTHYTWQA